MRGPGARGSTKGCGLEPGCQNSVLTYKGQLHTRCITADHLIFNHQPHLDQADPVGVGGGASECESAGDDAVSH